MSPSAAVSLFLMIFWTKMELFGWGAVMAQLPGKQIVLVFCFDFIIQSNIVLILSAFFLGWGLIVP